MIQVSINGIFITQSQASGILLKEQNGSRALPIVIGEFEAQSIAMAIENIKPPRPITHDLTVNILKTLHITLESVLITELKDSTFYALLRLVKDSEIIEVDSRPSDAIAIAVRLGSAIYVNEAVMDEASYVPDESETPAFESQSDTLEDLKKRLQQAVEAEEYEKAARIRDQIKQLESGSRLA